ncbi:MULTISPECIES: glycosyltransferase family 4 protein [unclassified Haladaptatus]|uniref:glycosyltransferase family 4 protein n=1 Tax=unclassified Haladaptatus TaxID=2622732 RepID=UPI00209C225E|nr:MULTISPECIES: glycosyltransferase family 4 protein [unclassified Haladaptatus]MCO8244768.1 glycosyltransferase family 4 protein [Haladaptatus sp. AB643]MCO8255720.1 glycosyltransferase family 4 protein [Haladaptatus sp. AB618]
MGPVSPNNIPATVERISTYFPTHDVDTVIFGPENEAVASRFRESGIETMFVGNAMGAGQLRFLLKSIVSRRSYDLYHTYGGIVHSPVPQLLSAVTETPVVTRFNGYNNPSEKFPLISAKVIEDELLRRSDALVFNSYHQMTDILREHGRDPGRRHHVISPGIDESLFSVASEGTVSSLRESLEIPADAFVLGTCQTPRPVKQPRKALEIVSELTPIDGREVHLVVVGDSEHVPEYKRYGEKIGVDENLHWVGRKPSTELSRWYSLFDVTILTSSAESFGMSISESYLCETPCVAFMVGGMVDQIQHGETGWLIRPEDTERMVDRISDLLTNERRRREFGENGREYVLDRFTLSKVASQYRSMTDSLVAR